MSTVYTTTVFAAEDIEQAQERALARAAEFFDTNKVTVELLTYDIDNQLATFRVDRLSGTLLG